MQVFDCHSPLLAPSDLLSSRSWGRGTVKGPARPMTPWLFQKAPRHLGALGQVTRHLQTSVSQGVQGGQSRECAPPSAQGTMSLAHSAL